MRNRSSISLGKAIPALRAALALMLGLPIAAASAAAFTWDNTTGIWSDGTKWGGSAPSGTGSTDVLVFGGDVSVPYTATNDVAATPFLLNQLTLQTTDAGLTGSDNVIAGTALRLTGTGPQILENGMGFTINTPVELTATTVFGGSGTGTVTLNMAVTGIADIVKSGPGTFRFGTPPFVDPGLGSSANTWMGRLTVNEGTFRFNNNAQAAPTALRANPVTMSAGATLLFQSKVTDYDSSARMGTLSGTGGTVQAIGQASAGSQDSLDIGIHAFADGDYAGLLKNTKVGTQSAGHPTGVIIVRGTAVQTLSGTLEIEKDMAVGGSATLRLAGTAALNLQTTGAIMLNGGTLKLDNEITNIGSRLRDGTSASTGVDVIGGGTLSLVGNAAGTAETISRLQLGSGSKARSGALTAGVTHNAGAGAATVIGFQSYSREQAPNPCNTVNFSARTSAGTSLPLGLAGNNPRIIFSTTPTGGAAFTVPLFNSLLGNTGSADSTTVGWATVNGTDFATHGANGIAAVAIDATPLASGAGIASANIQITTSFALTDAGGYSVNSINLAPSGAGQSLSLGGDLRTAAILLAGSTDYSITSASNGIGNVGGTGPRYFHIPQAVLTVGASLGTSTNSPVVKAGEGTLVLTNGVNVNVTAPLYINAGSVRATPGSSLPMGELRFRGGVLEITGGGTFSRSIALGANNLTWSGVDGVGASIAEERGSGGFAAVGSDVFVDLNAGGADNLVWESPGFLDSGFALILGSRNATAVVTFLDNINLTQAPPVVTPPQLPPARNYNAREIRVVDNPGSASDSAEISGVISGSLQNDLLKTGDGLLELTAANTMQGMIFLNAGTLKLTGSVAASILTDVQSGATLTGTGTATQIVLESGGRIAPGDGGVGTLNAANLTWRSGGTGYFDLGAGGTADRIALGSGALVKGSEAGPFTFNFNGTGATGHAYTLATFGSTTFTAANFSATNLAPGVSGVFLVSGGSLIFSTEPIEAWRQSYFGANATNSGTAGDSFDADGDGTGNLGEYVLSGSSPLQSSTAALPVNGFIGNFPTFTFTRNLGATDVTLIIEASPDLNAINWTAVATHPGGGVWTPFGGVSVLEGGGGVVTMTDALSLPGTTKRFYRLRVTRP